MTLSRLQAASVVTGFSAMSAWYGFMFGKESARKELADKINELKATIQKLESPDNA
ncbi:hypothetical protein M758_3G106700 [Ceratodon purpureus]|uniref:Uncharacterized protein n=1 Tax=Ceratodon purpureus TaxID=3225 RepID=A0A8T0IJJ8_CERPU|nr:hypothetical protein KC19_3G104700 [Ceratodon purpureus]KAG0622557.1 hypothetical protein M758_3G106700 [Ceratodon purpureus]